MRETVNKVLTLAAGIAIVIGAFVAWHFFHVPNLLAAVVAIGGAARIGYALDKFDCLN